MLCMSSTTLPFSTTFGMVGFATNEDVVIKPLMTELQKQKLKRVPNGSKLLAYFKAEDLPRVYGGQCECAGGCVLGRAAHDVIADEWGDD